MTLRQRILSVYRGEQPDVVPFMLDLSHWFYQRHQLPWDVSSVYITPEKELLNYHKRHQIGFYLANNAAFYSASHADSVEALVTKSPDGREVSWTYRTPLGEITRRRRWEEVSYSWGISKWGVTSERDLKVLGYALGNRSFTPCWQRYEDWVEYLGDSGVVYIGAGYSAIGQLLHYWMGVEQTLFASFDWNRTLHEVVDRINQSCLECIDLLAASPAEIIIMGDNFSSDVQPPAFFAEWSRPYYLEATRRLHRAGKQVAVHIDGRLRGSLAMIRDCGADCADAVTPAPSGDLTADQCRREAGPAFILSGGISPSLWLPETPREEFVRAVKAWIGLKKYGPRLIAATGDQVPPGAEEERIWLMRDLVEKHGLY
ncbi:MAG: uroporphyrinogen decarboxylase family protein [Acidobacteriota bacterium]